MQAWSKFTQCYRNKSVGKAVFYSIVWTVTFEISSRSSKSDQLFIAKHNTIYKVWSKSIILFKRHYNGKLFWSKFDILMCYCDLETKVKVTKILSTIFPLPTMCLFKFSQNPQSGSGVRVRERLFFSLFTMVTLRIRSRSPKSKKLFIVSH